MINSIVSLIIESKANDVYIDVDHTLINGNSGHLFAKFLFKKKAVTLADISSLPFKMLMYKFGLLNYNSLVATALKIWRGKSTVELEDFGHEFYFNHLKGLIYKITPSLIKALKEKNLNITLISASPREVLHHFAKELDVDLITSQLEIKDQQFTGNTVGPLCYKEGKLKHIQNKLKDQQPFCALSDSITDLPMLTAAKQAIVINPDLLLRREAKNKNWPVFMFE
jgi:HAD superfamily hydrolase (TIGR01490 family)